MNNLKEKILKNINATKVGIFERDEIIKLSYLAMLSGESVFMLGLPGVAKSLIARRMKYAIKDGTKFEYLMNKFSTPEEIFGPISLKELDNDNYVRKVEGYMPSASIAFLDEIWKASPAIQNTLLTIINEKIFRNGNKDVEVPLKLLISASNELPQEGEGLEALYDRFLIRYYVSPASTKSAFKNIIISAGEEDFNVKSFTPISQDEIDETRKLAKGIELPEEMFEVIVNLKKTLETKLKDKAPYVSDRRWKKVVNLLKINAYISGRKKINFEDLPLIKFCIVESPANEKEVSKIFDEVLSGSISKKLGSSIEELGNLILSSKELVKGGYINTKKHESCKKDEITYYSYTIKNANEYKYWIPIDKEGNIESSDDSRYFILYYTNVSDKTLKNAEAEEARLREWDIKSLTMNNYKMTKTIIGYKKVDNDKLDKAVSVLATANKLLSRVETNLETLIKELINNESLFTHDNKYTFEKTSASIEGFIHEKQVEIIKLSGEIDNAKKVK